MGHACPSAADNHRVQADDVVFRMEELLRHAKPVPLTDQVRLNPDDLRKLIDELREALATQRKKPSSY